MSAKVIEGNFRGVTATQVLEAALEEVPEQVIVIAVKDGVLDVGYSHMTVVEHAGMLSIAQALVRS